MKRLSGALFRAAAWSVVISLSWAVITIEVAAQSGVGNDEVKVSSRDYFPTSGALRVRTAEVRIEVVVRDVQGRPVPGLTSGDFKLFDRGQSRKVSGFSVATSAPVPGLSAYSSRGETDVSPTQDGTPATQSAQHNTSERPRFIALFFDDIHGTAGDIGHARNAAERFVKEALTPADRVGVFTSSSDVSLDFSGDVPRILQAIGEINVHPRVSESGINICPRISPFQAYQIVMGDPGAISAANDEYKTCEGTDPGGGGGETRAGTTVAFPAVLEQAEQTWQQAKMASQTSLAAIRSAVAHLSRMQGERVLIMASAGFLSGELGTTLEDIVALALHAQVVINALDAKGLYAEAPGRPLNEVQTSQRLPISTMIFESSNIGTLVQAGDAAMANLAASTGGLFFHDNNDLDFGFYRLGIVPEVRYELSFSADDTKPDGSFHPLKVQLAKGNHYSVESRAGYFAPTLEESQRKEPEQKLDREVSAADSLAGLPAKVTWRLQGEATGENDLLVTVHVELKALQFQKQKDRQVQQLTFILALFNASGEFVSAKQGEMDLALRQDSFDKLESNGINAAFVLDAAPGTYRLRAVASDAVEGRIYASSQAAVIR
jgi:VWFA-related protein